MSPEKKEHKLVLFLQLKADLFYTIESLRWFDIPVVYTQRNQINFAPDLPIHMRVEFTEWELLFQRHPFPEGDNTEILTYLFEQLQTDPTAFSPLNYQVRSAEQKQPDKTVFFNWEQIQAWENRYSL